MKHVSIWPNFSATDSVNIGFTTTWLIVLSGIAFYLGFAFPGTIAMILAAMSLVMPCSCDGKSGASCIVEVVKTLWKEFALFPTHKKAETIGWVFATIGGAVVILVGIKYALIKESTPPSAELAATWYAFGVCVVGIVTVMLSRIPEVLARFWDDIRP